MTPTPEQDVPARIAAAPPNARVVVDFDDTLLLTNSTLLFLHTVRPRWLVWLVFKLVGVVFGVLPRRWHAWQDAAVVAAVRLVCPWALSHWRRQAPALAQVYANRPLLQALLVHAQPAEVVVCSLGQEVLVRPLLRAMWALAGAVPQWHRVPLLASRLYSAGRDRRLGKAAWLQQRGWLEPGRPLVVVSDSLDDCDLLQRATVPLFVRWSGSRGVPLFQGMYLPLRYAHALRHPKENFIPRVLVWEEWVGLMLVFAPVWWGAQAPVQAVLGLGLLVASFWCVYEQGYAENDRVAVQREGKHPGPAEQARFCGAHHSGEPWGWVWASAFAAVAIPLLPLSTDTGWAWVIWMAALAGMRLTYAVYNHLQPQPRVWLYPLLQIWKVLPAALLLRLNGPGLVFGAAYALSRWFPYWIYRAGGQREGFPELALRTVLLLAGMAAWVAWAGGASAPAWERAQAGLMAMYLLVRARHEFRSVWAGFRWLPAVAGTRSPPAQRPVRDGPESSTQGNTP